VSLYYTLPITSHSITSNHTFRSSRVTRYNWTRRLLQFNWLRRLLHFNWPLRKWSSPFYIASVGQRKTHIASLLRKRRVYRICRTTLPSVVYCFVAISLLRLGSAWLGSAHFGSTWHGMKKHRFPYCCVTRQPTVYQGSVFVVTRSTSRCPATVIHVTILCCGTLRIEWTWKSSWRKCSLLHEGVATDVEKSSHRWRMKFWSLIFVQTERELHGVTSQS
jgi:hypothetical protein